MSTGDEETESLVDNLFREVDNQFKDLEREYSQARKDLASADGERRDTPVDALEASHERYELMSQVATLEAEVSRQADELDERDRMLHELGDKIAGFEADISKRDEMLNELHHAKQELLEERREQARISALLDARAAERQELANVTQRLQNERDNVQELLTTALARYDEVEAEQLRLEDRVHHLEAARDTAAHEHDLRAHELTESRAEMSKLADQLDELNRGAASADERSEKAEALAERRTNEAGYLNRRIDVLDEKLAAAADFESETTTLRRDLTLAERKVTELERELATQRTEATAANAAVDAIAERTADYDELVARIGQVEQERDDAREAASNRGTGVAAALVRDRAPADDAAADEPAFLATRARELGARRSNEAEFAAQAAEAAAAKVVASAAVSSQDAESVGPEPGDSEAEDAELQDLDNDDVELIESDLASMAGEPESKLASAVEGDGSIAPPEITLPRVDLQAFGESADAEPEELQTPEVQLEARQKEPVEPIEGIIEINLDQLDSGTAAELDLEADPAGEAASVPHLVKDDPDDCEDALSAESPFTPDVLSRKRTVLPADLVPNTAEAVAHLLNQPGVTAIVDARSTCSHTGIRPSELFDRVVLLRDHYDVPVEVVVTPVSTPIGGAPDLAAIGVHHVTGADTVADRIRALCRGLPADQPLVVIAGDDHVRRAAIGEDANVVEPTIVLDLAAE